MVARTVPTERRNRPKTFFFGLHRYFTRFNEKKISCPNYGNKKENIKENWETITSGSIERKMVAGIVATKENPQTGEKRRQVTLC